MGYQTLLILVFLSYLLHDLWSWVQLRHIPGPFLGSVSSLWQLRASLGGKYYIELKEIADKHGQYALLLLSKTWLTPKQVTSSVSAQMRS